MKKQIKIRTLVILSKIRNDIIFSVSNKEPKFIKSSTSLANSSNELDVYAQMNAYLDTESKVRDSRSGCVVEEIVAGGDSS